MTRSHFMRDLNIVSILELTSISNFLLTNFKDLNYSLASRFFWANSILSVTSSHFWADFWLCFGTPWPFVPLCLVSHPLWSPTGAHYFDNTSQKEKEDDIVQPNNEHVYYWEVTSDVSPQPDDPTCLTYTYISHQNVVEDYNSGLIGTLLICKPGENRDLMTFGRMRRYVEVWQLCQYVRWLTGFACSSFPQKAWTRTESRWDSRMNMSFSLGCLTRRRVDINQNIMT